MNAFDLSTYYHYLVRRKKDAEAQGSQVAWMDLVILTASGSEAANTWEHFSAALNFQVTGYYQGLTKSSWLHCRLN